jgi:hypothetical protein
MPTDQLEIKIKIGAIGSLVLAWLAIEYCTVHEQSTAHAVSKKIYHWLQSQQQQEGRYNL